uniref:Uncharacterized protein n=1 Tax=Anguilla anguilla TaxID=7936 RepID=A0A0E9TLT9_ANGAN
MCFVRPLHTGVCMTVCFKLKLVLPLTLDTLL